MKSVGGNTSGTMTAQTSDLNDARRGVITNNGDGTYDAIVYQKVYYVNRIEGRVIRGSKKAVNDMMNEAGIIPLMPERRSSGAREL